MEEVGVALLLICQGQVKKKDNELVVMRKAHRRLRNPK